jgi:hypothetical protein
MPITTDIMDHGIIGPAIREGIRRGWEQAGRQLMAVSILRRQIGKRFGEVPSLVEERLVKSSLSELEELSIRIFDAANISELFDK